MNRENIFSLAYSPTKTTERVLKSIVAGYSGRDCGHFDLTLPASRRVILPPFPECTVVIGVPVYGGRVPQAALDYLEQLDGNGQPVILVAVYGNRHYDDALLELRDTLAARNFRPVAAAAFVGEHSFCTEEYPTAAERPDEEDLAAAKAFGKRVRQLLDQAEDLDGIAEPEIPGDRPYKGRKPLPAGGPTTNPELCTNCGRCASVCPVGAIDPKTPTLTDGDACTYCCACIKACPVGARSVNGSPMGGVPAKLAVACAERREPETFLP